MEGLHEKKYRAVPRGSVAFRSPAPLDVHMQERCILVVVAAESSAGSSLARSREVA